jgi:hypothetical protein
VGFIVSISFLQGIIMIKKYLENEYKEDIKNVFNTESRDDGWFCIDYHNDLWTEIQDKNLALSKENPDRHFVLSSIFLFHFAVTIAMWDECSYNQTFNYDGFREFYEKLTGWPQMHLTYWKEFTQRDSEEEFLLADVKKILDRFSLMRNGIQNRTSEFMLSCIFAAMQGLLNDALLKWNVSEKSKVAVSSKVQYLLERIRDVLMAGYMPNEPEQEQENKDVDLATPQSNLYNIADDEFDEI